MSPGPGEAQPGPPFLSARLSSGPAGARTRPRPGSRASRPLLSGVADEDAFAEECLRRGQSALPAQPASSSARSLRPPRPAPPPRPAAHAAGEDEDAPGAFCAGVHRDPAPRPPRGPRGPRRLLCCCVLA